VRRQREAATALWFAPLFHMKCEGISREYKAAKRRRRFALPPHSKQSKARTIFSFETMVRAFKALDVSRVSR